MHCESFWHARAAGPGVDIVPGVAVVGVPGCIVPGGGDVNVGVALGAGVAGGGGSLLHASEIPTSVTLTTTRAEYLRML